MGEDRELKAKETARRKCEIRGMAEPRHVTLRDPNILPSQKVWFSLERFRK
jgi:hypothetical protein